MGNSKLKKSCRSKEYFRKYYKENREKIRAQQREYYRKNRESLSRKASEYYYANPQKSKEYRRAYYHKYKDIINVQRLERKRNNPKLRIICNLRSRLSSIITGKSKRTMDLVACDRDHLLRHLEVQFKKGMRWGNYGSEWVIDHHIPLTAFDIDNKKEFEACWHFSNLKPMWKRENIVKGSKICLER